jgi:hypothetical protein
VAIKSGSMYRISFLTISLLAIVLVLAVALDRSSEESNARLNAETFLVQNLIVDRDIINAVKVANDEHARLSEEQIIAMDNGWVNKSPESIGLKDNCINNEIAEKLRQFQSQYPQFVEIFVTDRFGLIVGETEVTSDYYQADEEWWKKAYNDGKGALVVGTEEYDESAADDVIGIFIPVVYNSPHNAIGVIKALVDAEYLAQ